MLFTDAYERTIDEKNRLQVPAPLRSSMDPEQDGAAFFAVPGERSNTLSLYPENYFKTKVGAMQLDRVPGSDALDFEQMFFSLASRVEPDKQGRIVLPERQLSMVELGSDVFLCGAHYRIDIWPKAAYEGFLREVSSRRAALQSFLRMSGSPSGAGGE